MLLGSGFAFAAALQPGPLQAFLLSRVLAQGVRRTLPAAFAPLLGDVPIALLALWILDALPVGMQRGLRTAGGAFLLFLAWSAWRQLRTPAAPEGAPPAPRTLLQAVVVNLLNPNPYLGWMLVLGPAALAAWAVSPWHAAGLVGSFYATMTVTLAAFILACGGARRLPAGAQRGLRAASALALAALGAWQVAAGIG